MASSYRFATRPRWIAGHVLALTVIVLFVNLGLWQLRRHDERSALDATLAERTAATSLSWDEALAKSPGDLEYHRVTVTGRFDPTEEVVLLARSFRGRSGHNVLTPFLIADGTAVLINRGWVPIDIEGPPVAGAEPPAGEVRIVGVARNTETRGSLGTVDPDAGRFAEIGRVDLPSLTEQTPYPLQPFYLVQLKPEAPGGFPLRLDAPEPGGGPPHLAYAVQWFAFTAVVVVGYPLLLRATARKEDRGETAPD